MSTSSPIEDYQWCERFLKRIFQLCGQDILADNYRRDAVMYTTTILLILLASCIVSSIVDTEHYDTSLRYTAASFCSGIIQITIKYIWMQKLRVLLPNLKFFDDIYRKNSSPSSAYYVICSRFARRSRNIIFYSYTLNVSLYGVLFIGGAFDKWRHNGKTQILHLYIPGVYVYSSLSNVFLTILNTLALAMVAVCAIPLDMLYFLVFSNVSLAPAIARLQMEEMTALLRTRRPLFTGDVHFIKRHFLHYIRVHHKYNENIQRLDDSFVIPCMIIFATIVVMAILCASVMSTGEQYTVFGAMFMCLFQIVIYCALGTTVEASSQQINEALYSLEWYRLPLHEQRVYLYLLLHSQQTRIIKIAGIKPLNMETCLNTIRAIYSYGMMIATTM